MAGPARPRRAGTGRRVGPGRVAQPLRWHRRAPPRDQGVSPTPGLRRASLNTREGAAYTRGVFVNGFTSGRGIADAGVAAHPLAQMPGSPSGQGHTPSRMAANPAMGPSACAYSRKGS
ncbi:hypothetical protein BN10_470033 [Phycicoccus elongatus Lp2]|uniref:Uncharacterized protein n=1 Tax=Phycicoccus elongatus Lp2 TaxID=1193181 RepID=N0DZC4_9MICO|nr:hypothetical protein BN10_470033 [Phycicoccus elongatus Lp2]